MRVAVPLLAILAACGGTSEGYRPFNDPIPDPEVAARGMEALEDTPNLGFGVVPAVDEPDAWLGMGDRVCLVYGATAEIGVDVFFDGVPDPDIGVIDGGPEGLLATTPEGVLHVLLDGTEVGEAAIAGTIAHGAFAAGAGAFVARTWGDRCDLVWTDLAGTADAFAVPAVHCADGADLVSGAAGTFAGGGREVLHHADGVWAPFADGHHVAVDDVDGRVLVADRAGREIRALDADGRLATVYALPGALVDFDTAGGTVVALTEAMELVRFDASTGKLLDTAVYTGPLGVDRVAMTSTGRGMVVHGPERAQFYALHAP